MDSMESPCGLLEMLDVVLLKSMESPQSPHGVCGNVWGSVKYSRKVISDRGLQFTAQFMRDLHKLMGVTANISTAYYPEMDGQMEHVNQEIEQYL